MRRPFRIGTVVESERDLVFAAGALVIKSGKFGKAEDRSRSDIHPVLGLDLARAVLCVSSTLTISPSPTSVIVSVPLSVPSDCIAGSLGEICRGRLIASQIAVSSVPSR